MSICYWSDGGLFIFVPVEMSNYRPSGMLIKGNIGWSVSVSGCRWLTQVMNGTIYDQLASASRVFIYLQVEQIDDTKYRRFCRLRHYTEAKDGCSD